MVRALCCSRTGRVASAFPPEETAQPRSELPSPLPGVGFLFGRFVVVTGVRPPCTGAGYLPVNHAATYVQCAVRMQSLTDRVFKETGRDVNVSVPWAVRLRETVEKRPVLVPSRYSMLDTIGRKRARWRPLERSCHWPPPQKFHTLDWPVRLRGENGIPISHS